MPRFIKGSEEAKAYMKKVRDSKKNKNKKGEGLLDDIKNVAKSKGKELIKLGIDKGVDVLKDKLKEKVGDGIFGSVGQIAGMRGGPLTSAIAGVLGNEIDKKLGTGVKRKYNKKTKTGAALLMP